MWLTPASLEALRQADFLYTTLYRVRRLHARTEDGVLKQAGLLADLRRHGRCTIFDLDVGGCTPEDMDYLTGAVVVIFSRVGFPAAFGHDDIGRIGDWMRDHQIGRMLRTLAADGADARSGATALHAAGFRSMCSTSPAPAAR